MKSPRITILKPGTFTDAAGVEHTYTTADLAAAAAAYDPVKDPAPLVVGHPQMDHPAYGWASGLSVEDGELVADTDPEKLEPAFAEAVRQGRYRKVSASFYPPKHKDNPKPGSWYLMHIGFLGAAAPAVKGLGTVAFAAEQAADLITIETATKETEMSDQGKTAEFAEREAALTRKEGELATKETSIADRERALETAAAAARHEASVAFAEALVGATKLAPAGKDLAIIVLDGLDGTTAVSFGEANEEITPLAAFKKLLEGAGTIVALGENAKPTGEGDATEKDPQAVADLAVAYAADQKKAGRIITVQAAVRHVMSQSA